MWSYDLHMHGTRRDVIKRYTATLQVTLYRGTLLVNNNIAP